MKALQYAYQRARGRRGESLGRAVDHRPRRDPWLSHDLPHSLGQAASWNPELVEAAAAVAAAGKPVVLIVQAGRPLTIGKQVAQVDAVLYAWHAGTMAGPALAADALAFYNSEEQRVLEPASSKSMWAEVRRLLWRANSKWPSELRSTAHSRTTCLILAPPREDAGPDANIFWRDRFLGPNAEICTDRSAKVCAARNEPKTSPKSCFARLAGEVDLHAARGRHREADSVRGGGASTILAMM